MMTAPLPRRALGLLGVLTLLWGTSWPLFPVAVSEVSVWTFRAVALTLAGGLLLAMAHARGQSLRVPRADWPTMVAAAWTYLVVWNVCTTFATLRMPSGQVAVLGFTMPLWAALLGALLMGQRVSMRMAVALALGAASVSLLMWRSLPAYAHAPEGFALGLLSAVGWAVGTLILKRRPVQAPVIVSTGWQLLLAAAPITVVAFAQAEAAWFVPSTTSLLAIGYLAVVTMTLGNLAWFSIVDLLPAQVAGLSSILVPMLAMVTGAWVSGEPLGPVQWAAMACSASALWLALGLGRPAPAPGPPPSLGP